MSLGQNDEKQRRRQGRRIRRFVKRNDASVIIMVICIPLIAAIGVFRWNNAHPKSSTPTLPASSIATSTTSSTLVLSNTDDVRSGNCVIWNQDISKGATKRTEVVPCEFDHLFENVSKYELQRQTFPTETEWDSIIATDCADPVKTYLGYTLDPRGKFGIGAIKPTDDGWAQGDRTVHCGIQKVDPLFKKNSGDLTLPVFRGVVKGQDQTLLLPIGACYLADGTTNGVVPCIQEHTYEVVGSTDISKARSLPASNSAWRSLTAASCTKQADVYAGGRLKGGLQASWLDFDQTSWDAGRRSTECIAVKYDTSGNAVAVPGSAKAP